MAPQPPRRASGSRPRKRPRTLEHTVTEIANRPAPIRRSIFDLLDTLIASRERPAGEPPAADSDPAAPAPRPKRRAPKNPGSR